MFSKKRISNSDPLENSTLEIFFAQKFENAADCIAGAKILLTERKTGKSLSTLINLYCKANPRFAKRSWIDEVNALQLAEKNLAWKNFLDTEYKNVTTCIKAARLLPNVNDKEKSISTRVQYYFVFHANLTGRSWSDAANALQLTEKSPAWKVFMDAEYEDVMQCIAAAKELPAVNGKPKTVATIINYYFTFHPELRDRNWINMAAALQLTERSSEWHEFLNAEHENVWQFMEKMPQKDKNNSLATYAGYYKQIQKLNHKKSTSAARFSHIFAALAFCLKNQWAMEAVNNEYDMTKYKTLKEYVDSNLTNGKNKKTIRGYISVLRNSGLTKAQITDIAERFNIL
jgi:hypothetical protein